MLLIYNKGNLVGRIFKERFIETFYRDNSTIPKVLEFKDDLKKENISYQEGTTRNQLIFDLMNRIAESSNLLKKIAIE